MIRLHTQDLYLPNLQTIIKYGSIIPNHILLFNNSCKGCKHLYLLLDKKRLICTSISEWRKKDTTIRKQLETKTFNAL